MISLAGVDVNFDHPAWGSVCFLNYKVNLFVLLFLSIFWKKVTMCSLYLMSDELHSTSRVEYLHKFCCFCCLSFGHWELFHLTSVSLPFDVLTWLCVKEHFLSGNKKCFRLLFYISCSSSYSQPIFRGALVPFMGKWY